MPFGFLGGAHFTSMSADPIALTIGGLNSLGGASAVLEYVWPPTPHPPTKPEVYLVMRASSSTKNTVKANECQVKKILMKWCLISPHFIIKYSFKLPQLHWGITPDFHQCRWGENWFQSVILERLISIGFWKHPLKSRNFVIFGLFSLVFMITTSCWWTVTELILFCMHIFKYC